MAAGAVAVATTRASATWGEFMTSLHSPSIEVRVVGRRFVCRGFVLSLMLPFARLRMPLRANANVLVRGSWSYVHSCWGTRNVIIRVFPRFASLVFDLKIAIV